MMLQKHDALDSHIVQCKWMTFFWINFDLNTYIAKYKAKYKAKLKKQREMEKHKWKWYKKQPVLKCDTQLNATMENASYCLKHSIKNQLHNYLKYVVYGEKKLWFDCSNC